MPTPQLLPAAARTLGAAVLGAGIWIGSAGPLQLTWGLVAVAAFVGWLIGSAARSSAPRPDPRVRALAVGGAVLTWLISLIGVYVYLSILPSEGVTPSEVVGSPSIVDFYAQQFGLLELLEAAAFLTVAWWSAR